METHKGLMTETAIVILNWNGIDYLRKFLDKVVRYSGLPGTEIYIADNGSTDGSADWIEENHKDVKLIRFDRNHGFAGGYNLALNQITADYFILVNSDIEVTERWLEPLISFLKINSAVASCQPKILSYSQRDHFEYAGAAGGYIDRYGYPFCRGRIFDKVEKDTGQYDDQVDIFWSTGACMAVRAATWKKCGGFDDSFFAHMEEIDLCWRFHLAGFRVSYVPQSVVYHVGGGALPYDSPFKTYLNFRNSLFLLYKNLDDNKLMSILFARRLLDGMAAIMFFLNGKFRNFKSVWKAHVDFYKSMSQLKEKRKSIQKTDAGKLNDFILNKSIIFEFYARGRRTFDSLKHNF